MVPRGHQREGYGREEGEDSLPHEGTRGTWSLEVENTTGKLC